MKRTTALVAVGLSVSLLASAAAWAHQQQFEVGGKKLLIRTDKGPAKAKFKFKSEKQSTIVPLHSPKQFGSSLLIRGAGANAGKTTMIELDPDAWKELGNPPGSKGYRYKDKEGNRGGITKIKYKAGLLSISGKGSNWEWDVAGPQDAVWVHFYVEDESYCAMFDDGGIVSVNEAGIVKAKAAPAPPEGCPDQVCGNGEVELGEACDDGNLDEEDGCVSDCSFGACVGQSFESTFEAIQNVIFENPAYGCSSVLCHGADPGQGNLDLRTANAYASLVNVPASQNSSAGVLYDRVEPGEPAQSYLYEKLSAATFGTPTSGTPMPNGGGVQPLTENHLEALEKWIRGGAPEDLVVEGTSTLLEGCLAEPDPLTIPPPDPPGAGVGVQLRQTPWDLPAQFENEICMPTYYDFTATSLVPAWAKVPCPKIFLHSVCDNDETQGCQDDSDCTGSSCSLFQVCQDDESVRCTDASECPSGPCILNNAINKSNECFAYHKQTLLQDPQSHHSIIRMYVGSFDETHASWGPWTYKFQDQTNPLEGTPCDHTDVDPATGYHDSCSGPVEEAVACLGAGAPDVSQGLGGGFGATSSAPSFGGSQEPFAQQEFFDGVFSVLPMQGLIIWNSHAFNLTSGDSTMSQYLNLEFAQPADQLYPSRGIFDATSIFVQNVPPFETREYCRTYTIEQGARLYNINSHTHRWGVLWRTWLPPNTPCTPGQPACVPRGDAPVYLSTEYTDPLDLDFDPPLEFDSPNAADRSFLFCSVYDNGSTPASPSVKRQSTSPEPPLVFGLPLGPGGPCDDDQVRCLGGTNKGDLCNGDDANCPGSVCDACPVRGGVTTEDEMFIFIGSYFVP